MRYNFIRHNFHKNVLRMITSLLCVFLQKKCPLCAKEFRNVTSHMLRTHCINWACDLCFYFRTASTAVMDKHVQNKHPFLNVEACPICKKAVEGFTGFCHHLRGHLDQVSLKCDKFYLNDLILYFISFDRITIVRSVTKIGAASRVLRRTSWKTT